MQDISNICKLLKVNNFLELLNSVLTHVEEGLIIDVGSLFDIKKERNFSSGWQRNFVALGTP
jgi:hypothetical protein